MARRLTIEDMLNDFNVKLIYERLKNLALNMFEWEGLPEDMRPEYIERLLYTFGGALFCKNKYSDQLICVQAAPAGGFNIYGEFLAYQGMGSNEYNEHYEAEECVYIRNNALKVNTHDNLMMFAIRIAGIERTIDVNVNSQKTPRIVVCDDKDILTFKNIFRQVDGNVPAIYADKSLNVDSLNVLDITAPFVADKLADLKHDIWNDALSFLGIDNANTDKRERLVKDEVNANNSFVDFNALYMLQAREIACKEINVMFGCNVSVKRREGVEGSVEPIHVKSPTD